MPKIILLIINKFTTPHYKILQFLIFFFLIDLFVLTLIDDVWDEAFELIAKLLQLILAAVWNISLIFSNVLQEHSKKKAARIRFPICCPSSYLTARWCVSFKRRLVIGSLRKSFLIPTRMIGNCGQKKRISGNHRSVIFSRLLGKSIE